MAHHSLLQVRYPFEKTAARFFIDGKRVSRAAFADLVDRAVRRDSFITRLIWLDGSRHRVRNYSCIVV